MKYSVLFLTGMLLCQITGSKGLKIAVELPSAAGRDILLAHYQTSRVLVNDTITLNEKGKGIFESDTLYPQGLYKIYYTNEQHFDFLLSADQHFTICNPDFSAQNIRIKGAGESEEFVKYMHFLSGQQHKRKEYESAWEKASPEEKPVYQERIDSLTHSLHKYWITTAEKYPGTWLATFLMANYVPEPDVDSFPEAIRNNDSLRLQYAFDFQKKHFFDFFDVTDERFLTTPLLPPKLETYFSRVLYQTIDSLRVGVLDLIEKSRPSKPMFRYIASFYLNLSSKSKVMGMDALFVELAKKYYLSGEAFWADSTTLARIRENVIFREHNLIGQTAPDLLLEDITGKEFFSLHQIDKKITLLLIYEPGCSHCKEFVPRLYEEVYMPNRDKGLEVYAVYSMDNHREWEDFVRNYGLTDWINVWDENHSSGFKILYDARTIPQIYVLDKNKTIIAKKLSVEQVKRIVINELVKDRKEDKH